MSQTKNEVFVGNKNEVFVSDKNEVFVAPQNEVPFWGAFPPAEGDRLSIGFIQTSRHSLEQEAVCWGELSCQLISGT